MTQRNGRGFGKRGVRPIGAAGNSCETYPIRKWGSGRVMAGSCRSRSGLNASRIAVEISWQRGEAVSIDDNAQAHLYGLLNQAFMALIVPRSAHLFD